MSKTIERHSDKLLFTPGPLTTSRTVKQALLRDWGSRDVDFIALVKSIRRQLLPLGGVDESDFTAILMQGSGTFCVESVISSTIARDGKLLVISNGAYGRRIAQIASVLKVENILLEFPETELPDMAAIENQLAKDPQITDVAMVHCETSTGMINPIQKVGEICQTHKKTYFVDAMSSFGAVPIDMRACGVDYLVSSANKCIEGVPGFSFALARKDHIMRTEGRARSVVLDLHAQWKGLEDNGQFRFTPPTHTLLAFHQALLELEQEGGVEGRGKRYRDNHQCLLDGMTELGYREYLPRDRQGYIITPFHFPEDSSFRFETFYQQLNDLGFVIYPGKVAKADCFRIGNIGRIFREDIQALLRAMPPCQSAGMGSH